MSDQINWKTVPFNTLSLHELYNILALRQEIFIVEQTCPYPDADGSDDKALHMMATNEAGKLVAYCRLFGPGIHAKETVIGRVVVHQDYRKSGLGRKLMNNAIAELYKLYPDHNIKIGAQSYLRRFYESFGFVIIGDEYDEDGIPHFPMRLSFS